MHARWRIIVVRSALIAFALITSILIALWIDTAFGWRWLVRERNARAADYSFLSSTRLQSLSGRVFVLHFHVSTDPLAVPPPGRVEWRYGRTPGNPDPNSLETGNRLPNVLSKLGFAWNSLAWTNVKAQKHWWYQWHLAVPYWFLVALSALSTYRSGVIWRRLVRSNADSYLRCRSCGYDLRATPERCPECGLKPIELAGSAT